MIYISSEINIKSAHYITPEMYGAKGDGVTDDTEALQNAINDSASKVLYLQNKYKITDILIIPEYITMISDSKRQAEIISSGPGVFDKLRYAYIKGIYFTNKNDEETNFINGAVFSSVIIDNSVKAYTNIITGSISNLSVIERNHFTGIKNNFCHYVIDSFIMNNYINASTLYFDSSICFDGGLNNSVISSNYIDYWHIIFNTLNNTVSTISNNRLDDSHTVFYQQVFNLIITGNMFSNIHYDANNFNIEISADKQKDDWAIFRFTGTAIAGRVTQLHDVTFSNNVLSDEVDYLIYINEGSVLQPCVTSVHFIGNSMHPETKYTFKALRSSLDKSLKDIYLEFMERKHYSELPNPTLSSTDNNNPCVTYNGLQIYYNNSLITNIDGVWYYQDGKVVGEEEKYEEWTFTLKDGTTVTKKVVLL